MSSDEVKTEQDWAKEIQPSLDSLFSNKYDVIVKPSDEKCTDPPCNLSLLVRVLLIELKNMTMKPGCTNCVCNIPNGVSL
jgi:hypothetical protein